MSMHRIPLTQLEHDGLSAHGLDIGTPSQLSDVFRQGVAFALDATEAARVKAEAEWRTTAVMLEQANAGLAQLNGKLRAELSALKAHPEAYQFDGQVLRDEHGNYLAEFMAYEQSFIDRLLHPQPELKAQQVGQESEPAPKQHPDDAAVDRFAAAMKAKLARSREKGRHGWQNCTAPHLSAMLYDHLYKADPLDVGNFAMMLHQNGQAIELPFEARGRHTTPRPAPAQDVAGLASSDPVAKAEFETRLRKEFESRWPKPKGVTWGAGINDYCVSEFAEGIALSYPDMWMAYKAGAMRTNQ